LGAPRLGAPRLGGPPHCVWVTVDMAGDEAKRAELVARLEGLGLGGDGAVRHHAACSTAGELAAACAAAGVPGTPVKNLFLGDKKGGVYVVTARHDAEVDLATLGSRLGVGRSGLRMGKEEAMVELLGCPQGCLTPLAAMFDTGRKVRLLLDAGLKAVDTLNAHAMTNDTSVPLSPQGLEAFLTAVQADFEWVDFEHGWAPGTMPDLVRGGAAAGQKGQDKADGGKKKKKGGDEGGKKEKGAAADRGDPFAPGPVADSVPRACEEVVQAVLSALNQSNVDDKVIQALRAEAARVLQPLKNAAYARGLRHGKGVPHQPSVNGVLWNP